MPESLSSNRIPIVATDSPAAKAPRENASRGFVFIALLLPWIFLWNGLRVEWSVNEQYGYGWFVPFFAAFLFHLRWSDAPPLQTPRHKKWLILLIIGSLLLLVPLRLIQIPNPDWRSAFWVQSFLCCGISLAFLWLWGGGKFAAHFLFPILFLLVAVPWPSEIEEPLVQGLMREIAGLVAETMNLLGIPAQQAGNLIQIRGQTVGVNEACSGIRSLQTTLMAGLLLGELRRLGVLRRGALLAGGLILALFANYLRSGILVWIAGNQGIAALEHWHDTAGLLVLVVVIVGLYLFSSALHDENAPAREKSQTHPPAIPLPSTALRLAFFILAGVVLGEGFAHWWYASPDASSGVAPWSIRAPLAAPAYRANPIDNRTRSYLRYDSAIAASWRVPGATPAACSLFFLRWEAGRTSAIRATMHQPHICLTALGMKEEADYGILPWTFAHGLELPVREYIFIQNRRFVHVFYIVWREGLAGQVPDPSGNRWDRLEGVLQHRRNPATQTLELVVSGPASRESAQAVFREEMGRLLR